MGIMMNYFTVKHDDSSYINCDSIAYFANTNERFLEAPIRGIVIEFPGLGGGSCLGGTMERGDYGSERARAFAKQGIVTAYLFTGLWSWGNRGAVRTADAIVSALAHKYSLAKGFPLVASGGSMGGVGALNYATDTRYPLRGVVASCPCVDVLDRFNCHPDFPRTYISAVAELDMPFEDGLRSISPIERTAEMPFVPYFICSNGEDEVFPEEQCGEYVAALRRLGHNVTYYPQPGLEHGDFFPEVRQAMREFMLKCILQE